MVEAVESASVETLKSEAQVATEFKYQMRALLDQACIIMDRAHAKGMHINFNLGTNQLGRAFVNDIHIIKVL